MFYLRFLDKSYHISTETELDFCLLIPYYNNAAGLQRSLRSINYPRDKHLVVVVDDGSETPITPEELQGVTDSYIHILRLPQNSGITTALNAGLKWIATNVAVKYIARLDCDDTCEASRFYEQVSFLDENRNIGLLGTWCRFTDHASGASYLFKAPFDDNAIRKAMHVSNVFIHPAVIFRLRLAEKAGFYPYDFRHAEDYAFFWSLLKLTEGAVLQRCLVTCAINSTGISSRHRSAQLKSCRKIISLFGTQPLLKKWGIYKTWLRQLAPPKLILFWKRLK
ncbi:MAG: hypothetical protein JWP88_2150 [Flaviaesturariibacter sp.]|nr:hypothetical protein [Flaviaesturariibacter sp.]